MKNLRSPLRGRGLRPVAPRCRNGVSSLLRLSQAESPRLPQPELVRDWADRAANLLLGAPEFVVGRLAPR